MPTGGVCPLGRAEGCPSGCRMDRLKTERRGRRATKRVQGPPALFRRGGGGGKARGGAGGGVGGGRGFSLLRRLPAAEGSRPAFSAVCHETRAVRSGLRGGGREG